MKVETIGAAHRSLVSTSARQSVLAIASRVKVGSLTINLPGGNTKTVGQPGSIPHATIDVLSDDVFPRILFHGEIGLGEAYQDGLFQVDDLVSLLEFGVRNRRAVNWNVPGLSFASRLKNVRIHRGRKNTRDGAKDNIHAHYDLGNDFYSTFLDDTLTYSCAYFASPEDTLRDAQINKYRRMAGFADIQPSDHVLEIGSGWGGFATFAAKTYGCRVTTVTISQEQLLHVRQKIAEEGLADLVDVQFIDYRDVTGVFDKIVSIEMFESIGHEYFETFFRKCHRLVKPGGKVAIQVISVADRNFEAQKNGVNWIQKYIFYGGVLPSLAAIEEAANPTSLVITRVEDIGPHYVLTLRAWREKFLSELPRIRALGFDDRFIRTWEYYLCACEAAFLTRATIDLEIVMEKPNGRATPFGSA